MRRLFTPLVALATAVVMLFASGQAMAQTEVTLWTHWAAEKIKREFVEDAISRFEEKNPGVKIKATWYEKTALYAALKTALRAGQAPDIFYAEPDQVEYMDNGFLLDLSDLNWAEHRALGEGRLELQGQALRLPARGLDGRALLQQEDDGRARREGARTASSSRRDAFLDIVKKAKAKGIDADGARRRRPSLPGRLPRPTRRCCKKLGTDDYDKLLKGKLAWTDPRVVDTLKWVRSLIDAGLLPTTLHERSSSARRTPTSTPIPAPLMFLNGSWYTSRAFNPPDKGGQPKDFPLGIMQFPAVPGAACNECRTHRGRRQLRRQRRDQAREGGDRLLQFDGDARRWATAGSTASWCRPASRATRRRSRAERRVLQDARRDQRGREVLFRHRRSRSCRASRRRSSRR